MRIMFTSVPTHSHIAPMLPLVDSAARAGHEVTFVTGQEGMPLASRTGVHAVELGRSWSESIAWYREMLQTHPGPTATDAALTHGIVHLFVDHMAAAMATDLVPLVTESRPDIVIGEMGEYAGRTAATLAGIPHVVHGFGPQQSGEIVPEVTRAVIALQRPYGITDEVSRTWSDELYLDVWPTALAARDPSGTVFEDALPIRPAAVSAPLPPDPVLDGLPHDTTVYVTLGTMFNASESGAARLDEMIAVFAEEPVNAIVTIGRDGDPDRFGSHGDNVRVRGFVPQDAVIPHVDAVLSHAGAGTSLAALAHGVPHVMAPVASDQHRIASRIAAVGAGIALPADASVEAMRTAVREVLDDDRYVRAARSLAPSLLAMSGPDQVLANIIDQVHMA
jgi:UDP:flavonoid glycosyltransferase YjiC (YdhE family)